MDVVAARARPFTTRLRAQKTETSRSTAARRDEQSWLAAPCAGRRRHRDGLGHCRQCFHHYRSHRAGATEAIRGPSVPRAASGPPATALATAGAAAATGATASPSSTRGSAIRCLAAGRTVVWEAAMGREVVGQAVGRLAAERTPWPRAGGSCSRRSEGARPLGRREASSGAALSSLQSRGPARPATGDGHVAAVLLIDALQGVAHAGRVGVAVPWVAGERAHHDGVEFGPDGGIEL